MIHLMKIVVPSLQEKDIQGYLDVGGEAENTMMMVFK